MRNKTKIKLKILAGLLIYFLISKTISKDCANTCAILAVFILTVDYINLKIKIININSKSTNNSSHDYLPVNNTLTNSYCIVKYFPEQKIIVMDNPKSRRDSIVRALIIDERNNENINFCWAQICKLYDKYTFFDNLYPFVRQTNGRPSIMLVNSKAQNFTVENIEEFISSPINNNPKIKQNGNSENGVKINEIKKNPLFVDIRELAKHETKQAVSDAKQGNRIDLKDLSRGKKVYVNYDDAMTISVLPGINIVKAKKLVEYRNIHGLFKDKKDFINVSGAKEHFHNKILGMISVIKYHPRNDEDNLTSDFGRIVDY